MITKKTTFHILLLALVSTIFTFSASASHLYDPRQNCEEISQYFDPSLPFPSKGLTGIQQNCESLDHHLPFPGKHKPDIKLNEHKETIKTSHQPWSEHNHRYVNDSQEDLTQTITENGITKKINLYYLSALDTFEFHLESDFMENIELDTVQCAGLPDGNNCSGNGNFGKNENGGTMGYEVNFDKEKGIIRWYFPGKSKLMAKPNYYGINPTLDKLLKSGLDTTDESQRMLQLGINFKTKDIKTEIWSATVTSRVLIKDFVAKMTPGTKPILSDWQGITHAADESEEKNDYYWFPVGTTTTIWERAKIPETPNLCTDLNATLLPGLTTVNGKPAHTINLDKITFSPKDEIPTGAKLKLTSVDDATGEFWILSPLAGLEGGSPYVKIGTGTASTHTTYPDAKIYYIGNKPTKITIELTGIPSDQISRLCHDEVSISIRPETKECKNLLVDHPEKIYTDTVSIFSAKALNTDGENFAGKIRYWVDPGYGEFYVIKPKNLPANNSKQILEATPLNATVPLIQPFLPGTATPPADIISIDPDLLPDNGFSPKHDYLLDIEYNPDNAIDPYLIIAGNGQDTYVHSIINIASDLGTGSFGIENLSENLTNAGQIQNFADLNLIKIPDWMETGAGTPVNPVDPTDTFKFNPKTGQNSLLAVNLGNLDIEPQIIPDLNIKNFQQPFLQDQYAMFNSIFESITVDPNTVVYFRAKKPGQKVIHVQTVNSSVKECHRDFDIEPFQQCANLNFTSEPAGPLPIGQAATLKINPVDKFGQPLPPYTGMKFSSTAGGKFTTDTGLQKIIELNGQAQSGQFPIQFSNSAKAGKVFVSMDPLDTAYSAICKGEIEIKAAPPSNVCTALSYNLAEFGGNPKTSLEKGKMYQISANLDTTVSLADTITYTIDNQYGVFIKADSPVVQQAIKSTIQVLNPIDYSSLSQLFGANNLSYQLTSPENTPVILLTFSNPPATPLKKEGALKIQGSGYTETACNKQVDFIVPEQPPVQLECKNINLDPSFNPNSANGTIINIIGDYKDHKGDLKVTIATVSNGSGKKAAISKIGGTEAQEIIFTQAEIQGSTAKSFFYYKNDYNELNDDLTLTIEAVGSPTTDCKKVFRFPPKGAPKVNECVDLDITKPSSPWEIDDGDEQEDFRISVDTSPSSYADELYYNWEVRDGDGEWQNGDDEISEKGDFTQTLEDFEEGTLVKVWASTSKFGTALNNCSDSIEAEKEDEIEKERPKIEKFVYPGNKEKDADDIININNKTDDVTFVIKFNTGNDIDSAELWDSELENGRLEHSNPGTDGYLSLDEMEILLDNKTLFNSLDSSGHEYQKNSCGGNSKTCIETGTKNPDASEFSSYILKEFSKGSRLIFKNLPKNSKILIKYRMTYENRLNDEKCQTLIVCGEQFKNEARYEAESRSNNSKTYKDSATAKIIVICPYVLTRQGGDVFFHDVIDTGVDVAQCSEVKSCDGPCITPKPPERPGVPKTGTGDIPEDIKLELPSHDVCRYSNIGKDKGNSLEGYNNVLKNFSSTICELRADVSKAWTKKNISESIAANVKRLSRWEENLSGISNISSTSQLPESSNGVFVKKSGDLIIGSLGGYEINKSGSIPAAQTYIVIGHDLYINSDIIYKQLGLSELAVGKNVPSAAFIVIDGNIIIDKNVKQIDGILMAVDMDNIDTDGKGSGDKKDSDGQVKSSGYTGENTLTINGNLIGNVYDLFKNRQAVGDPRKEEGSITIRYDERILLNTPPGINELVNIQQAIVPN